MITETSWTDALMIEREVLEKDLLILTPYKNSITITLKYGTVLVQAKHDGTDEGGDMETLKMLCIYRYNKGEVQ